MAELSKTARASMGKVVKEKKAEESVKEAIRQIRIDRQAGLFIVRMDRVDKLLAAYDELEADARLASEEPEVESVEDSSRA